MEPARWNVEDLPRSGDSRSAPRFGGSFSSLLVCCPRNSRHKACHPERSEGPMYRACTTRSFCTSPVMLGDFASEFLGHYTQDKASQRANNSPTNFRSREAVLSG